MDQEAVFSSQEAQVFLMKLIQPHLVESLTCKYYFLFLPNILISGGDDPNDLYPNFPDPTKGPFGRGYNRGGGGFGPPGGFNPNNPFGGGGGFGGGGNFYS